MTKNTIISLENEKTQINDSENESSDLRKAKKYRHWVIVSDPNAYHVV